MQGRRLPDRPDGWLPKMEPGDYVKVGDTWYAMTPNGAEAFLHPEHEITVHEDGSLTVAPSILIEGYEDNSYLHGPFRWHGYLEHGVWREC